jgi:MFS family permease
MAMFLLVAAGTRFISMSLIYLTAEKTHLNLSHSATVPPDEAVVSIIKLSLVMMLFRCAVNLSSPFYSTYMLQEIDLGFTIYSFLTALPLITKALCLTNWARLLDDNRKFEGLAIATFAIGTVPVLWAINESTPWLSFLQILSGLSWAGFDLISILLVQNMYPRSITQKLGVYLALSSLGSVAGGIAGGYILRLTDSYHTLFAFSGVLRLLTGFGLLWYLRRHHLFRFKDLRVKSGIATLMTVRPSIEAAAKILPLNLRRDSRSKRVA